MAQPATVPLILALASSLLFAAGDDLPKGKIVDKVACLAEPGQSYALYLPSRYDAGRAWPVLFCFDPGARGRIPVELFQGAAEQYGYIVTGSNNSRNGAAGQGPESMSAMWSDAQARFAIDRTRLYAVGMSGGARLVCGFAQKSGIFAGIIAFAAGFPGAEAPSRAPYLFFGAAGVDDFNYPEMRQLDSDLDKAGATKRIITFDGGHGWPPPAICSRAIEWMELQSMKMGKRPQDTQVIGDLFEKAAASIQAAETSGNIGQVYQLAKAAAEDFAGLKDISAIEDKASRLGTSKEVRRFLQDEKDQQVSQSQHQSELFARWENIGASEDFVTASRSFSSMLHELRRQSEAASDSAQRRIARRVLNGCYVSAFEDSRNLLEQKNYTSSARALEMAVAIFPDRPQALFALSATYARAGDRKKAVDALKRASEHGFRDAEAVEKDNAFVLIRNDPGMRKILEEIRKKR